MLWWASVDFTNINVKELVRAPCFITGPIVNALLIGRFTWITKSGPKSSNINVIPFLHIKYFKTFPAIHSTLQKLKFFIYLMFIIILLSCNCCIRPRMHFSWKFILLHKCRKQSVGVFFLVLNFFFLLLVLTSILKAYKEKSYVPCP